MKRKQEHVYITIWQLFIVRGQCMYKVKFNKNVSNKRTGITKVMMIKMKDIDVYHTFSEEKSKRATEV